MMFLEEFAEYFINSKSGQFLYSETESVMWLPVTASEQETMTGAAHREIHEITPTDIVPSEKEGKTDFAVKNGCVNSIGSRVLKNQCPVLQDVKNEILYSEKRLKPEAVWLSQDDSEAE